MKSLLSYSILLLLLACRLQGGKVESRDVVEESGVRVRKTVVTVVAWSLPDPTRTDTNTRAQVAVMKEFVKQYPQIVQKKYRARYESDPEKYGEFDWGNVMVELVPRSGIQVEGTGLDSGPLMAIAGGVAPDIMYVNFRQSDTYIQEGFLYPLDKEEDGYFTGMDDDERSFIYHEKVMPVVRRKGPGGEHVWAMPTGGLLGKVFLYRKDLLAKYGVAEPKPDWTWEDLFDACRKITHPAEGTYGIRFGKGKDESWYWVTFLWSAGGDVMAYDAEKDEWTATFDSDEAVTALDFYVRLTSEHWRDPLDGRDRYGYATKETDSDQKWELGQIGFFPTYIDARLFATIDPDTVGMVPVPLGYPDKNGVRHRGGELNSRMQGIFAGCDNPVVRDAAWEYMRFCESKEGVEIYTRVMVEGGLGRFINPDYLRQFGYEDMIRLAPAGWEDTFKIAIDTGMPEPYGKNCNLVYYQMTKPLEKAEAMAMGGELPLSSATSMKRATATLLGKRHDILKKLLVTGVADANEKMLGILSPQERRMRRTAAAAVMAAIVVAFALVFRKVIKVFTPPKIAGVELRSWGFVKYRWAYLCLLPAVLSILLWRYIPLLMGSVMALQDYRIMGGSQWVWLDNFGNVLWDGEWWRSVWNSIRYCFLVITLTFLPPVILAVLLQEIPRGKVFFRTVFYLPAVITGLVVIYLWRSFYEKTEYGVLNAIMLKLPAIAYIGLAVLFFYILLFFGKRLFLHENYLGGLLCLLAGLVLYFFFFSFATPILRMDELDWPPATLVRWNIAFYSVLVLAGAVMLFLAGLCFAKGRTSIGLAYFAIVVLGTLAIIASYWYSKDWKYPMRLFLRLFQCMKNPYRWLDDPGTAMICCVLPMIWAGMGPGCLIYLAALKGISDEFYEAADIDGATFADKILFVVLPILKPLLIIQFVGVFISSWASTSFILAMTGGANQTEVAELHIFYKAYLYLNFGPATAMAWVLGFMLIGFTVYQLQILSKLEFKATDSKK